MVTTEMYVLPDYKAQSFTCSIQPPALSYSKFNPLVSFKKTHYWIEMLPSPSTLRIMSRHLDVCQLWLSSCRSKTIQDVSIRNFNVTKSWTADYLIINITLRSFLACEYKRTSNAISSLSIGSVTRSWITIRLVRFMAVYKHSTSIQLSLRVIFYHLFPPALNPLEFKSKTILKYILSTPRVDFVWLTNFRVISIHNFQWKVW